MQSTAIPFRSSLSPGPRPFLKWAGGKTQLLEHLGRFMTQFEGRYYEPFLGGAALFFSLRRRNVQLSDINEELISCYLAVRDFVDEVISELDRHKYDKDHFYAVRELDPMNLSIPARAARTIFLNKTGFNGLYRVNGSGRFNVPFGRHRNPTICDRDNLRACSEALQSVEIRVADFEQVAEVARAGDFVYFDPPYVPLSDTADFTAYAPGGFSWTSQQQLAKLFAHLTKRGVKAMLSNSDVPELRKLYRKFRIEQVTATRRINSNVDARGNTVELVVLNY